MDNSLGVVDSGVVEVSPVGLAGSGSTWAVSRAAPEGGAPFVPFTPAAAVPSAVLPPFILARQNFQMAPAAAEMPATTPTTMPAMAPPESLVFLLGLIEPEPDPELDPEPEPELDPEPEPDDPPDDPPVPPDEPLGFGEDPFEDEEPEPGEGLGLLLLLLVGVEEGTSPPSTLRQSSSPAACASTQCHQLQPLILTTNGFSSPLTKSAIKSTSALNASSRSLINDSRKITFALIVSQLAICRFCDRRGNT